MQVRRESCLPLLLLARSGPTVSKFALFPSLTLLVPVPPAEERLASACSGSFRHMAHLGGFLQRRTTQ
jgi:hypothetical protein